MDERSFFKCALYFSCAVALTLILGACSSSDTSSSNSGVLEAVNVENSEQTQEQTPEQNSEQIPGDIIPLQRNVWRLTSFVSSNNIVFDEQQLAVDPYTVYFAPLSSNFQGTYNCTDIVGTYAINNNQLLVNIEPSDGTGCDVAGGLNRLQRDSFLRVIKGPAVIATTPMQLTLSLPPSTEKLIFSQQ